jgi:hypothetical protein
MYLHIVVLIDVKMKKSILICNGWYVDGLVDHLVGCLVHFEGGLSGSRSVDLSVGWLIGLLIGWLIQRYVGNSVSRLAGHSVSWLVSRQGRVGWSVRGPSVVCSEDVLAYNQSCAGSTQE